MSRRATILFVCTGNTCRSPMAEALCNEMLAERGVSDRWVARSAGTAAIPGMPANERAIETLRADGVDVESHRSTPLDEVALSEASLILTMTQSHKDEVL